MLLLHKQTPIKGLLQLHTRIYPVKFEIICILQGYLTIWYLYSKQEGYAICTMLMFM